MNIQLYAGDVLVYDSRLPAEDGYSLLGIRTEESLGAGGVARLTFPPAHPQAARLRPFSVPVEIYTDGKLRWRGRPLPPSEDHYLRRTIVCEGELCFFQDSTHRPHVYQATATEVFASLVAVHNGSIEPWKRFAVGNVSADFEKISVTLELDKAKTVYDALMQLVKQCGGYFFFDSSPEGERRVNWYVHMPYICNQKITVDSNLLKYSSSYDISEFATRLVPYGAKGEDGARLRLDDNGKDYVENAAAIELRGIVEKPVVYNDITTQDELRDRAQADVDLRCLLPRIIQLSAVDMARYNLALDHFAVGQLVPAESAFHDLSGSYGITKLVEDYLNPKSSSVTLSRETVSLKGGNAYTLTQALVSGQKSILDQANEYANGAAQSAVSAQSQKYIFDKLTNGGTLKGLYMADGDLYFNASYMSTGVLASKDGESFFLNLDDGNLKMQSADKSIVIDLNTPMIKSVTADGNRVELKAGSIYLYDNDGKIRGRLGKIAGSAYMFGLYSADLTEKVTFDLWDDAVTLSLPDLDKDGADSNFSLRWKTVNGVKCIVGY